MEYLFNSFLIIHIICSTIGLLSGTMSMVLKKGNNFHRKIGQVYYFTMLIGGLSSMVLSAIHRNVFLFLLGIFTVYLIITGKRYLSFKNADHKCNKFDWLHSIAMFLVAGTLVILGIYRSIDRNEFGVIFIFFGLLGLRFSSTDYTYFRGKSKVINFWLTVHLQRFIGSYIAALTAFLVVNAKYIPKTIPFWVVWLLPSIILIPVILRWTRKYRKIKQTLN